MTDQIDRDAEFRAKIEAGILKNIHDLSSHDPMVRMQAVEGLGDFAAKQAIPHLARLLGSDPDQRVRKMIVGLAIPEIGLSDTDYKPLLELLTHPDSSAREAALDCLFRYREDAPFVRESIRPVIGLLADECRAVRVAAARFLVCLAPKLITISLEDLGQNKETARAWLEAGDMGQKSEALIFLSESDQSIWPALALAGTNSSLRLATLVGFSRAGSARLADILAFLEDPSPDVREISTLVLQKLGDRQAARALRLALTDVDSRVRSRATRALSVLFEKEPELGTTIEAILPCLHDDDPSVKDGAVFALQRICSAVASDAPAILSAQQEVRLHALGIRPDSPNLAQDLLTQLTSSIHSTRFFAAQAMITMLRGIESAELKPDVDKLILIVDDANLLNADASVLADQMRELLCRITGEKQRQIHTDEEIKGAEGIKGVSARRSLGKGEDQAGS